MNFHCSALLALLFLPLTGCATAGGPPISEIAREINATRAAYSPVVVPGDRVRIQFSHKTEWNQTVLVEEDGQATLIGVDRQPVAGLLPDALDEKLTAAYASVLPNPELTIGLETLGPRTVTVMGEVANPGAVNLEPGRHLTLVEALGRVGGHNKATAWVSSTLLVRWDAEKQRQLAWTIDARPKHWDDANTIFLQPYDVVYVPNTPIDEVAIWVDNYIRRMIPFPYLLVPQ